MLIPTQRAISLRSIQIFGKTGQNMSTPTANLKVVGYTLSIADAGSSMFEDADPRLLYCGACGGRLDFFAHNDEYQLEPEKKKNLFVTYDGQTICSEGFRDFCMRAGYRDLRFLPFERDREHFHFLPDGVVRFDDERRRTRFLGPCDECGNFREVIGATPAFLRIREPLPDGIFRSDLLFGQYDRKHPLFLFGCRTIDRLKEAGFGGLFPREAYGE
jgi:hypothetical protein